MAGTAIQSMALSSLGRLFNMLLSLTTPRRPSTAEAVHSVDCGGLEPGEVAPDFTLPRVGGRECSLSKYAGQRVLLVFMQSSHQASRDTAAELNRLQRSGELQVLAIHCGRPHEAALWADDALAAFPVLVPAGQEVAGEYEACATPFAFVIDEQGRIASSGNIDSPRSLAVVLDAAAIRTSKGHRGRLTLRLRRAG